MRLLSFVSDVERALRAETSTVANGVWEAQRMVNFQHGLVRLSLTPRPGVDVGFRGGVIFVQAFTLADGSLCLKASLNWKGSEALPVIAIYSTPGLNWALEAARVASVWLQGPPAVGTITTTEIDAAESAPLTALAG